MEVINKMLKTKIGTFESIFIILSVIIANSILTLPRIMINKTNSATLLNIIFITIIAIIIGLLIIKLLKSFPACDIIDISEYIGGNVFKNIIGIIFIGYFIFSSSILLRNLCEGLENVYFQMTDIIFIILLFIIGLCITNHLKFNGCIKSNSLILPIAFISIILIFFSNFKNFSPQKIFPLLGNGPVNTFVFGLTNLSAFQGILFIYLFPPLLKEPEKFKKITTISIILTGIYIFLCVSIILLMFPAFYSTNEIMPLYLATRYISLGSFLQRLESIFMLVWIMSFLSYLSISCKFSINIFQKITKIKNSKPIINIFGLLILGISLLPKNLSISNFLETTIINNLSLILFIAIGLGILIIANIKRKKFQKSG